MKTHLNRVQSNSVIQLSGYLQNADASKEKISEEFRSRAMAQYQTGSCCKLISETFGIHQSTGKLRLLPTGVDVTAKGATQNAQWSKLKQKKEAELTLKVWRNHYKKSLVVFSVTDRRIILHLKYLCNAWSSTDFLSAEWWNDESVWIMKWSVDRQMIIHLNSFHTANEASQNLCGQMSPRPAREVVWANALWFLFTLCL